MKKKYILLGSCSFILGMFAFGTLNVDAATIECEVRVVENNVARTYIPDPYTDRTKVLPVVFKDALTTQLQSGIPVKIVNESGEVVLDTVTAKLDANDMYDGGRFKIENLPAGTYTATIYPIEKWSPVERGEDKQYPLVPTFSTTFTLEDESATKNLYWLLTSRVHQVVSYSKVGRFKNGAYGDLFQNGSNVAFMFWYNGAREGYEATMVK